MKHFFEKKQVQSDLRSGASGDAGPDGNLQPSPNHAAPQKSFRVIDRLAISGLAISICGLVLNSVMFTSYFEWHAVHYLLFLGGGLCLVSLYGRVLLDRSSAAPKTELLHASDKQLMRNLLLLLCALLPAVCGAALVADAFLSWSPIRNFALCLIVGIVYFLAAILYPLFHASFR
jgi:hypothetical protein